MTEPTPSPKPHWRRPPSTVRPFRALGERVRELRDSVQQSQEQLAKQIGMSRGYFPLIERGRTRPSPEMLDRIARALAADPNELKELAGYATRPRGPIPVLTDRQRAPILRRLNLVGLDVLRQIDAIAQILAYGEGRSGERTGEQDADEGAEWEAQDDEPATEMGREPHRKAATVAA